MTGGLGLPRASWRHRKTALENSAAGAGAHRSTRPSGSPSNRDAVQPQHSRFLNRIPPLVLCHGQAPAYRIRSGTRIHIFNRRVNCLQRYIGRHRHVPRVLDLSRGRRLSGAAPTARQTTPTAVLVEDRVVPRVCGGGGGQHLARPFWATAIGPGARASEYQRLRRPLAHGRGRGEVDTAHSDDRGPPVSIPNRLCPE